MALNFDTATGRHEIESVIRPRCPGIEHRRLRLKEGDKFVVRWKFTYHTEAPPSARNALGQTACSTKSRHEACPIWVAKPSSLSKAELV